MLIATIVAAQQTFIWFAENKIPLGTEENNKGANKNGWIVVVFPRVPCI
jgi:hypothetical protein